MKDVRGYDGNGTMGEDAGLNERLFGAHERSWQSMLSVIVHMARIELCNGFMVVVVVSRSATQMHNAAVNVVFLNQVCNVPHKIVGLLLLQWCMLQKQVICGIGVGAVQQFMFIGMQ